VKKISLDYNDVFQFMKEFEANSLNRFGELIIDEPTNSYVIIKNCRDIEELKLYVVYSICRPIGKGLQENNAKRLLRKFNKYFKVNLTRSDFRLIYAELCYESKLGELKDFIKRGFPVKDLKFMESETKI